MKIPQYLHSIKQSSPQSSQPSPELQVLLGLTDIELFLVQLNTLKRVLKLENNDLEQIIGVLDRCDEYLEIFIGEINGLMILLPPATDPASELSRNMSVREKTYQDIQRKVLIVLKATHWILSSKAYNRVYQSLDRVHKLLVLCDDFEVLSQCMLLMYSYFSDDAIMTSSFLYAQNLMEDLLYLCKYSLNHLNSFSRRATFQFTDYFRDDPRYRDFRSNILKVAKECEEPGFDSSLDFNFLRGTESSLIVETDLESLAGKEELLNSLEVVNFLQRKTGYQEVFEWSAGGATQVENKRIFYGLLSVVRYSRYHRTYGGRIQSMQFILASLQNYVALTKLYSLEKSELLNQVFVTNLDFGNVLREILNLFYLQLTPEFHTRVLMTVLNILSLDDHFDFKEYMSQINNQFMFLQKLFKDCLARRISVESNGNVLMEVKREKTRILTEKTALNSRFLDKLLLLLKKEIKQFYLDEENNIITTQIYSMCTLLGSLMEMNDSESFAHLGRKYFLYTYKHLLVLNEILWNLIPNQDLLNNYGLFERLIDRLTRDLGIFLEINEKGNETFVFFAKTGHWKPLSPNRLGIFVEYMIKLIDSPFFRKISMRNQMVPTLARKIADSEILIRLKTLIETPQPLPQIDKIFLQTITLVGDIAREIPSLIDRLISMGIMKAIMMKFESQMPRNVECIPMIIYFLNMLCLNEQGQVMELEMDSLTQVFKLLIRRDFLEVLAKSVHNGNKCPSSMAYEFLEMLNSVEKLKPRVCELVLWTFKQLKGLKEELIRKLEGSSSQDFLEEEVHDPKAKAYLSIFPISHIQGSVFTESGTLKKEFVDLLKDYNKVLQNFLRFFSRLFSVNCNIIDELIAGRCIDMFLELIDSPLLLFADKTTVAHSLSNCFKVFIMNIYKLDLNEKISEEIQRLLSKIESFFPSPWDSLKDFSLVLDVDLYHNYLAKGLLDETYPLLPPGVCFLGKLLALENLNEFLRLMVTSKHIHEEANVSNEGLLRRLTGFLRVFMRELERLGTFNLRQERMQLEDKEANQENIKKLLQASNPLALTLKKVFSQNLKEILDSHVKGFKESPKKTTEVVEILVQFLLLCLEDLEEQVTAITSITLQTIEGLYCLSMKVALAREFLQGFLEPFRKNIALHPTLTLLFAQHKGFEKLFGFLTAFLRLLARVIAPGAPELDPINKEALRKISDDLSHLLKCLLFIPLESGFGVYLPDIESEERGDSLLQYLSFVTLENLKALSEVLIDSREIYLGAKIHTEFKPLAELPLILLSKALKLTHHNQRKPPKKNRFNSYIVDELVQMGFEKERVEQALEQVENPTVQGLMDWLLNQPKEDTKENTNTDQQTKIKVETTMITQESGELKLLKPVGKEEFLAEKKRLSLRLAEDLLGKLYYLEDFDELAYDFLKLLLDRSEFEELRKPMGNKFLYLILRAMKRISQSLIKKFNFKVGLKGSRELLEQLKSDGELIKELPEETVERLGLGKEDLAIRNLNILLPFYSKITYKLSVNEKNGIKIKPVMEILKIAERLIEHEEETVDRILAMPTNSLNLFQEFLLKILLQAYEVLDLQDKAKDPKTSQKKKLRSKQQLETETSTELKDFYAQLYPLLIRLISLHNALVEKDQTKTLLVNSIPMMLLKLLRTGFKLPGSAENIHLFMAKKGLQEILRVRSKEEDFSRNGELLLQIVESIVMNDNEMLAAHYELEIKRFFLVGGDIRKDVPLNEFLSLTKGELNVGVFEETAKRICLKTKAKGESEVKVSLRPENSDVTRVTMTKGKIPGGIHSVQSIFQPFPENYTLIFSENGMLLATIPPGGAVGKESLGISQGSLRKSSRKTSKNKKGEEKGQKTEAIEKEEKAQEKNEKGKKSERKDNEKGKKASKKLEKNEESTVKSVKKSKEKTPEETEEKTIFAIDFTPSEGLQSILTLVLDSIINQFLEEISTIEDEEPKKLAFSYPFLIKLLHVLLHKYPILGPFILKYNCGKHLKKQPHIRFDFDYKEISFLSFLLKIVLPLTLDKFRHLIFELCLDTYLFCPCESSSSAEDKDKKLLIPFAHEIRKKVLLDLFIALDKEISIVRTQGLIKGLSPNNELLTLITFHMYLMPIRDIARISTHWAPDKLNLNFLKLYQEIFKLLSPKDIYQIDNRLDLVQEPLSILYQYLLGFILNRKGVNTTEALLMPNGLLAKQSSFSSEWEYMMNPTISATDHSHLHIEETGSSYSNDDYSIDTFMNEIYQYHEDDQLDGPPGVGSNPGDIIEQPIEEESSGAEEESDYVEIENLEDPEPAGGEQEEPEDEDSQSEEALEEEESSDDGESVDMVEDISESLSSDHGGRGSMRYSRQASHMESEDDSESESDSGSECESRSGSRSESEDSGNERGDRRHHSFFEGESRSESEDEIEEENSSEDDEGDEDELIDMHSEREDGSLRVDNPNRRRFMGSVNFIFRRDRLDREDRDRHGRLRGRRPQDRKKKTAGERSLQSILSFDYLQFDPELQRVNERFTDILQKAYDSKKAMMENILGKQSEPWAFSLRVRLHKRISEAEQMLFSSEEGSGSQLTRLPKSRSVSLNIGTNTGDHLLYGHDTHNLARRSGLNWDFLMNSTNGMVMFVSGRDTSLIDLNPGNNNNSNPIQTIPQRAEGGGLAFLARRRMGINNFFNDWGTSDHQMITNLQAHGGEDPENPTDLNGLRDRLIRELSEAEGAEEEKEDRRNTEQLDPLFLDTIQNEMRIDPLERFWNQPLERQRSEPLERQGNQNNSLAQNANPFLPLTHASNNSNALSNAATQTQQQENPFNLNLPVALTHSMGQGPSQDMDNASFFASLPPELREEVLMSSDPAFLGTLPPEILSEFPSLRGHAALARINNPLMLSQGDSPSSSESEMWPKPKKQAKKEKKVPVIGKQKDLLMKNPQQAKSLIVEEKVLENLVGFMYVDSQAFKHFPFVLLKTLMAHPANEKKMLDCLMGLLKGDLPLQDLLERDSIITDKQKVFQNISLKILTILAVYTKHSVSGYFLERTHRLIINKDLGPSALQDLIALLGNRDFLNSYVHLKLLISLIANLSRKVKAYNEKKINEEEKFKLEDQSIGFLCNVLNSDILDDKSLKSLNNIISIFSLNKSNLQDFVNQMRSLLLCICEKMNGSLEENLLAFRRISQNMEASGKDTEESLINRLETEIEEENKIYRIFKIIKKLFEKCLQKSMPKKAEEKSEAQTEKTHPASGTIEEEKSAKSPSKEPVDSANHTNSELRKTFKILISDKALNNVWINVTELLILINEVCPKSINLSNPIIHKMTPIIECFFIIYRILNDEEASFEPRQSVHALRKYYSKKTMPEISALIHNETPSIAEECELKNLLSNREKLSFNDMFTIMCEKNKNIINMMVKQNIALLNESFSMIIKKMPKILDFDNKKSYFRSELKKLKPSYPSLRLKVRRNNVFLDSYNVIRNLKTEELRRKLVIEFVNEPGIDQGGLIREFYSLLSREIFNPGYCLFKTSANNVTFQPSPQSYINDQHLNYFKFVGRVFGKGLHDGFMMDAFFTRSFYKHMLGQALTIYDMEDIDPEYFKNLKWILENDISPFELTFSYESDNFGKIEIVDLIPNGRNIPVTEDNKLDYVQKICYAKMAKDIQEQIKKFLEGFHELIPPTLVSIFDSRELELMISGLPDIDIQDLKDNTEYINYTKDSRVIVWLWDILSNLDKSDKAAFLQFVTGTSKVPLEGFKGLKGANGPKKFNIQKCFDATKLPSSHTCFNQLDLPDYESKDTLNERLLIAIREGKEFGFM